MSVETIDFLEWIEKNGACVWPTREQGKIVHWTVHVLRPGIVIRPRRATLLAALIDAMAELANAQEQARGRSLSRTSSDAPAAY